jgi:hypothetical protein
VPASLFGHFTATIPVKMQLVLDLHGDELIAAT